MNNNNDNRNHRQLGGGAVGVVIGSDARRMNDVVGFLKVVNDGFRKNFFTVEMKEYGK